MNKTEFLEKFSSVFEHSPWVAESVYETGVDDLPGDAGALGALFASVFMDADRDHQLATMRAHPRLVCALAEPAELTPDSAGEQSGAGLDECNEAELAEFSRLNTAYDEKFGFPFIIAVRGRQRQKILQLFRMRLQNDGVLEYQTAIRQTCRIALFRIGDILET
jgi:2-oxo-4-hydroxy-4-carboxy-5-ureidoimidazoline decarboxylase